MPLNRDDLIEYATRNINDNEDAFADDCNIIEYLLDNCEITIPQENRFFVRVNCGYIQDMISNMRAQKYKTEVKKLGLSDGEEALAYTGYCDFNHTSPNWESVITLGIWGLRQRVLEYAQKSKDKKSYYLRIVKVYDAALKFMERAADTAFLCGKQEMANGLYNLVKNPPQNMFEAMQTTLVFYMLVLTVEGTIIRTMGRLDKLLYPHYIKENDNHSKQLILDYFNELDRFKYGANIPFAIGGTDEKGNSLVNELSYKLLEVYKEAETSYVKLHLLCSKNIDDAIIESALDGVRNGHNSIVFMSDEKIIEALINLGEEREDAVNYHVVGCYECGGNEEVTCSCNARVNLPKALELTLNRGRDMLTDKLIGLDNDGNFCCYEDLYSEFVRQTEHLCDCAIKTTDVYEKNYKRIHSAPFFSSTYTSALNKGGDIYGDYTAKYNNSSVNALGLGTVTDSLAAIKKLVFEDKRMSLEEFVNILKSDWKGQEVLRLTIKNKFPKFGLGDTQTDAIAQGIVDILAKEINARPNAKGGKYRLGLFSLDWRWEFGKKTAASADGRLCGETISQNTSAAFGCDREGATGHLISVGTLDNSQIPNGSVTDIDLHISNVHGENGMKMLLGSLKTYFELGGFAVQYNVLDTEVLKDAIRFPDKYPNLQVRLCGWNVLFSALSDKEKEEFIARSVK